MNKKATKQRTPAKPTIIAARIGVPPFGVDWPRVYADKFEEMVKTSAHEIKIECVGTHWGGEEIRESDGKKMPTVKIYTLRVTAQPKPYKLRKKELEKMIYAQVLKVPRRVAK